MPQGSGNQSQRRAFWIEMLTLLLLGLAWGFAYMDRMAITFLSPFIVPALHLTNLDLTRGPPGDGRRRRALSADLSGDPDRGHRAAAPRSERRDHSEWLRLADRHHARTLRAGRAGDGLFLARRILHRGRARTDSGAAHLVAGGRAPARRRTGHQRCPATLRFDLGHVRHPQHRAVLRYQLHDGGLAGDRFHFSAAVLHGHARHVTDENVGDHDHPRLLPRSGRRTGAADVRPDWSAATDEHYLHD